MTERKLRFSFSTPFGVIMVSWIIMIMSTAVKYLRGNTGGTAAAAEVTSNLGYWTSLLGKMLTLHIPTALSSWWESKSQAAKLGLSML